MCITKNITNHRRGSSLVLVCVCVGVSSRRAREWEKHVFLIMDYLCINYSFVCGRPEE